MRLGNSRTALGLFCITLLIAILVRWLDSPPEPLRTVERDLKYHVPRALLPMDHRGRDLVPVPARATLLIESGVGGRRIAGQVVLDGKPVAAAAVHLQSDYFRLSSMIPPVGVTDSSGRFDFGLQPPTYYSVVASAPSLQVGIAEVNLQNPRGDPRPDELIIELAACDDWQFGQVKDVLGGMVDDGSIQLAVPTSSGWPVPVFEFPLEMDGSFSICRPRARHQLWVQASGYATVWLQGPMPHDGWSVQLVPGGIVKGRVVDVQDRPIEGGIVSLQRSLTTGGTSNASPFFQTTLSQGGGGFQFNFVGPGSYDLAVQNGTASGAHASSLQRVSVTAGGVIDHLILKAGPCRNLAGHVLLEDQPVIGARVGANLENFTQVDGSFLIKCADVEEVELKVDKYDVVRPLVPAGEADLSDLIVRVTERSSIAGRVSFIRKGVAGAIVTVNSAEHSHERMQRHRVTADASGRYEVRGLSTGNHQITAQDPESGRRSEPMSIGVASQSHTRDLDIELEIAGVITGVVVDAEGAVVPNVEIHLRGDALNRVPQGSIPKTNESGAFSVSGLVAGNYTLCLGYCRGGGLDSRYLPSIGDSWPKLELPKDDSKAHVRLELRGRVGLSISGRVRHGDGSSAPFAAVRTSRGESRVTADASGGFQLTDLIEGEYDLHIRSQDGGRVELKGVEAGSATVEAIVPRAGHVHGTVTGGSGRCAVELVPAGIGMQPTFFQANTALNRLTDVRDFSFSGIQPGDYSVRAQCEEGVSTEAVTVSPGERAKIVMEAGDAGAISGVAIMFPSGETVGGISCHVAGATEVTDSLGEFHLKNVFPGETKVSCKRLGNPMLLGFENASVPPNGYASIQVPVVAIELTSTSDTRTEATLGATLSPLRVGDEEALVFSDVVAGGPANVSGIGEGDVLLSVSGASASEGGVFAAANYIRSRPSGTILQISVRSAGSVKDISLVLGSE